MYPYDIPIRDFCMIAYHVGICEIMEMYLYKTGGPLICIFKTTLVWSICKVWLTINFEKIGGETLSFGDCSADWEWATAFCNLPGTLFPRLLMMIVIMILMMMMMIVINFFWWLLQSFLAHSPPWLLPDIENVITMTCMSFSLTHSSSLIAAQHLQKWFGQCNAMQCIFSSFQVVSSFRPYTAQCSDNDNKRQWQLQWKQDHRRWRYHRRLSVYQSPYF